LLVNNSGGPAPGRFQNLTDDHWRQGLEAVTLNFVRFIREVAPYEQAAYISGAVHQIDGGIIRSNL
jgi:NAD(P)-dependent dehydrogenase (short-subunit alcohol dehydrogenase family)